MVKLIQAIRWQEQTICLSVFDRFVGLSLKVLSHLNIREIFRLARLDYYLIHY